MEDIVWPYLHKTMKMIYTENDERIFRNATICHICGKDFVGETKHRDHCHLTGRFRGAAHASCYLKYQVSKTIPIVFHNLDYDSHFLIERLANAFSGNLHVIPKNSEHYIAFTKEMYSYHFKESDSGGEGDDDYDDNDDDKRNAFNYRTNLRLKFIDSYKFLQSSLARYFENCMI